MDAARGQAPGDDAPDPAPAPVEAPLEPRASYNRGLEDIESGHIEAASGALQRARDEAGRDGELRYRAVYALGWVAAAHAEVLAPGEPKAALAELESAAERFREALRLRSASEDARINLEIALRRAQILADQMRERSPEDLRDRVDALVQAQRDQLGSIRVTLGLAAESAPEETADATAQAEREVYRGLSSAQRLLLADADRLAEDADRERASLESTPEQERKPEDRMRAAQILQFEHYLHRARERMGHARRTNLECHFPRRRVL